MATRSVIPSAGHVRPPAVAGLFYPSEPRELQTSVERALRKAPTEAMVGAPKVLVVPHAGYIYSGDVAARAFALLAPLAGRIARVVIMGPAHRVALRGIALPANDAFATPLGVVEVDREARQLLSDLPAVVVSDAAHAQEHSLEVQLPFLQRVLGSFRVVPLLAGAASSEQVAEVLQRVWGGPETLIVISSDLSHYHPYDDARAIDDATIRQVLALDPALDHEQACGATPLAGLIEIARRRHLSPRLLAACNSGDTAGDKHRVVGYASFAFDDAVDANENDSDPASEDLYARPHGPTLLAIARRAIGGVFGLGTPQHTQLQWLDRHAATFVTLRQDDRLRGCVGSLQARRPLRDDVAGNAVGAAFRDPRFMPLSRDELEFTRIEVSLLTTPQPVAFRDAEDLCRQLVPHQDGVIVSALGRQATFLPQVWEQLPEPQRFLEELKGKAGLPASLPVEACSVQRYQVRKWVETSSEELQ